MTLADLANLHVVREAALPRLRRRDSARTSAVDERWARAARDARPVPEGRAGECHGRLETWGSFAAVHTTIESMRLLFADRDMWIGDPDVTDVPAAGLLSDGYRPRGAADPPRQPDRECEPAARRPTPSTRRPSHGPRACGSDRRDRLLDHRQWGNAVAMTSTVADTFGSGIMSGYGFELNDSLNLFNLTPKANAATGNPGANDAGPDKRPMGSMTPTIVVKDGEPILVTGTYGSAFIPSLVFNVVTNVVDFGMTLQQAVDAPRMRARFPKRPAERPPRPGPPGSRWTMRRSTPRRRSATSSRSRRRRPGSARRSARRARPASTRPRSTSSAPPTNGRSPTLLRP